MKYLTLTEHDLKNMETVLGEEKDQVLQAQKTSDISELTEQLHKLEGAIDFIIYVLKPKLKEAVL